VRHRDVGVAVAGGGIGGMALALSLHAEGITDVEVYESAPAIRELGGARCRPWRLDFI
jgi:2-polyprenyl-6-methoxyphenol hydroxylase-like FAD-dependent oxidoreductase